MGFPGLVEAAERWVDDRRADLAADGVDLTVERTPGDRPKTAMSVQADSSQRLGSLTIWDSGELDCQVLRKDDDFLVLNDTRIVSDPAGIANALDAFALVVRYFDPPDRWSAKAQGTT